MLVLALVIGIVAGLRVRLAAAFGNDRPAAVAEDGLAIGLSALVVALL